MKTNIIVLLLILSRIGFAQITIKKSSLDSGGKILQQNNIFMMMSIGEIAIQENSQGQLLISEGFINPDMTTSLGMDGFLKMKHVKIFPNPTVNFIKVDFQQSGNYQITIIDINSKIIYDKYINDKYLKIDMKSYRRATYLLIIKDLVNNKYQNFKIIKE